MTTPKKTADSERWRDKYLTQLDEQERSEKAYKQTLSLLQKAVHRATLAAEGQDAELDEALQSLREQTRRHADGVADSLSQLDGTLKSYERRHQVRVENIKSGLQQVVSHLQQHGADSRQSKQLLKMVNNKVERLEYLSMLMDKVNELASTVDSSMNNSSASTDAAGTSQSSGGLLSRWFKGTATHTSTTTEEATEQNSASVEDSFIDEAISTAEHTEPAHSEPNQPAQSGDNGSLLDRGDEAAFTATASEDDTPTKAQADSDTSSQSPDHIIEGEYHTLADAGSPQPLPSEDGTTVLDYDRPIHEPQFSRISDRITQVLTELLDKFPVEECVDNKAQNARERIASGLNWFELVPTLEDIRDLIMQAYLAANNAFGDYLLAVNTELEQISQLLGVSADAQRHQQQMSEQFSQSLSAGLDRMQTSVAAAETMEGLKSCVNQQLGDIRTSLETYQQQQQTSNEASLTNQLQELVARVQQMEHSAEQQQQDLEEQRRKARQDSLTELPNREAYTERANLEYQRWHRYGNPLTLAVCDIDFFKRVNDNYGHQAGDRVLKVIGKAISKRLREVDFFGRYGGEEFVALMPETDIDGAMIIWNKIREAIAGAPFRFKDKPVQITLSVGVTQFIQGDSVDAVFARADKALYQAKENGRNQCCDG